MKAGVRDLLTVQSRPHLTPAAEAAFSLFSERFCRDARRLNRLIDKGAEIKDAKKLFIREGLTARQFNSITFKVKGARKSRQACVDLEIADKKRRMAAIRKRLAKPADKGGYTPFEAHQKKRKHGLLKAEVARLSNGASKMVFGGRKLWNAQHHLEENGYGSHEGWLTTWRATRSSEFLLVGSKDESFGNQSCQWNPATRELAVRLPDSLGGIVRIPDVTFPHNQELIEKAILEGRAVSYRFLLKKRGWYILASAQPSVVKTVTDIARGTIGVDVGPGLIAVVETDAIGNPVARMTYRLSLYGKTTAQAMAIITDITKEIATWAVRIGKPVVIEDLDFTAKKADLKERGKGYARMLSGFAYQAIHLALRSKCAKSGVQVFTVNPAFSSAIGVMKFAAQYGLSGDEAAALSLARRAMRLRESLPSGTAFDRPEDRSKHVWSHWRRLGKALRQGRHAFIAAKRGPGGGKRVYPSLPARAAPA